MGGLWGDALGDSGCACPSIEPQAVDTLAQQVRTLAAADAAEAPHAAELVTLLFRIADTARETNAVRRAADVVREDVELQPLASVSGADKVAVLAELRAASALDALFHVDAGPYTDEARSVALLSALDRMRIARGLPERLKVYAVGCRSCGPERCRTPEASGPERGREPRHAGCRAGCHSEAPRRGISKRARHLREARSGVSLRSIGGYTRAIRGYECACRAIAETGSAVDSSAGPR
jgi:hypothetical protein